MGGRIADKHTSQRDLARKRHGIDDYITSARALARSRGKQMGWEAGEGFRQHVGYAFPRDDVLSGVLGARVELVGDDSQRP